MRTRKGHQEQIVWSVTQESIALQMSFCMLGMFNDGEDNHSRRVISFVVASDFDIF